MMEIILGEGLDTIHMIWSDGKPRVVDAAISQKKEQQSPEPADVACWNSFPVETAKRWLFPAKPSVEFCGTGCDTMVPKCLDLKPAQKLSHPYMMAVESSKPHMSLNRKPLNSRWPSLTITTKTMATMACSNLFSLVLVALVLLVALALLVALLCSTCAPWDALVWWSHCV